MDCRIIILGGRGKVVPAASIVGPDDTVTFEAQSTEAVVTFPDMQRPFRRASIAVPPDSVSTPEAVTGLPGVYPYSVWCSGSPGRSASGDSDPIIIVRR
jgi:hypothetical protein